MLSETHYGSVAQWWASVIVISAIDIMGAGVSVGTTTSMVTDMAGEVPSSSSPFAAPTDVGVGVGAWLAMVIVIQVIITGVVRLATSAIIRALSM